MHEQHVLILRMHECLCIAIACAYAYACRNRILLALAASIIKHNIEILIGTARNQVDSILSMQLIVCHCGHACSRRLLDHQVKWKQQRKKKERAAQ